MENDDLLNFFLAKLRGLLPDLHDVTLVRGVKFPRFAKFPQIFIHFKGPLGADMY